MVEYIDNGRWRTARKPHACRQCGTNIEPGERYWEDFNETPSYQTGDAYCPPCATEIDEHPDYATWPRVNKLLALASPDPKGAVK